MMEGIPPGPGLLRRGWRRLVDGDRPWGSVDIRPIRMGLTQYVLVVYPPGISVLRVTEDDDVGVIGVDDDGSMRTAPLAVVSGAVVVSVTGSSPR